MPDSCEKVVVGFEGAKVLPGVNLMAVFVVLTLYLLSLLDWRQSGKSHLRSVLDELQEVAYQIASLADSVT